MTLFEDILARIAYEETVKDCKKRNPDLITPAFDEVMSNEDVIAFIEECAECIKVYLENKYIV